MGGGGGAGNPGGTGSYTGGNGGDGCGGLILLVGGDLTIGASGGVYAKGVAGSSRQATGQYIPGLVLVVVQS